MFVSINLIYMLNMHYALLADTTLSSTAYIFMLFYSFIYTIVYYRVHLVLNTPTVILY